VAGRRAIERETFWRREMQEETEGAGEGGKGKRMGQEEVGRERREENEGRMEASRAREKGERKCRERGQIERARWEGLGRERERERERENSGGTWR
jgi:hypothetical protein